MNNNIDHTDPAKDMNSERGNGGETHQRAGDDTKVLTTQQGVPISDNQNSLKAGSRGPTLLEDFVLREKINHFDHERIPERIVHARGSAAHGYFELTESLEEYTTAKILTETGKQTPLFTRFSTVAGNKGSKDTPRDVRGFSVKVYTEEGNWDIVGNNMPIFFIQDAIKFPDLIHAVKPEPDRGFPQAASAHDTFWDFVSLSPETMHNLIWLMSDRGLPRSLRMMEGFGIHSYRLIDKDGRSTFVRFHWKPVLGVQSTTWDEAVKISGADPDYHRRDLFESIDNEMYPEWEFGVQLFTEEEADNFPFDHLDATKLIPEELVPVKIIGKMVLNRNVDNFFAETEQVAFCPSHVVPGIDYSNDPLLQGRLFSYLDTQLSRLGSPNFAQIPINAPKCPFANNQQDGHMQMQVPKTRVMYEPQSLDPTRPRESVKRGFASFQERLDDGVKGRIRAESFADHYSQPRMFYRSQTATGQAHIASAYAFELGKVDTAHVRTRTLSHLRHIDEDLANRVATALGMELPEPADAAAPVQDLETSKAVQTIGITPKSLEGRLVGILVAEGSSHSEVEKFEKAARAAGANVKIVAPNKEVTLDNGTRIQTDERLAGAPSVIFDAIVSIIMHPPAKKLAKDSAALDWFNDAYAHCKAIAYCPATEEHILSKLPIEKDAFVTPLDDVDGFIENAKTRLWEREPKVRDLA
ncbi:MULTISPECIES: catalase [Psychrobacter]|uniref:Catalase n=1 Tax=Psychrobacter alimentarius TaxID=261164 RepID=A0ABM5ZW71_9GAMM|nr:MULTISPECIES: catalase [Psychrobacter]AMT96283.1 Catalase [Psychrobacter alimentarius]QCB31313.1 catalase [Psychrobacter sp. PAMC27889]